MLGRKSKCIITAVVCSFLYIMILWNLIPFVYAIIDDRSMMEFVSGQYLGHPDAHTIFMGYWYSLVLSGLYLLCPQFDWYALGYLAMQGMCMSLVVYRLISRQKDRKKCIIRILLVFLLFTVLGLQIVTQMTFTTTAAALGVTVIFWYMTAEEINWIDAALLAGLCFFTYQVRYDVFYMVIPVCGILWLFRAIQSEKKSLWHSLIPVCVIGVCLLGILGDVVGYGSPEWRAYKEYDESRTTIYDFPDYTFPIYEGAEEFYSSIGIEKKSRARTLINYNYTADDRITPEFFEEYIYAYQETFPSSETRFAKCIGSVKEYLKGVRDHRFHVRHGIALVLYSLLLLYYLCRKKWLDFCKIMCVTGIQILMWIYLLYRGRIPERVIFSMNLLMIVTLLVLCTEILREAEIPKGMYRAGIVVAVVGLCSFTIPYAKEIRQENLEMSHKNEDIEELKAYCMSHPENFYFNDVTSVAFTTYNVHLWQQEPYVMNYMSLGDWMSYSPLWQEKLEQQGITSVKEALYEWDNVYLICSFDKGLEYLISLYDNVECTEADKVAGFRIYRLQSL